MQYAAKYVEELFEDSYKQAYILKLSETIAQQLDYSLKLMLINIYLGIK